MIIPAIQGTLSVRSLSPHFWLDASDINTVFDATSGGSLVSSNGANVKRIEDKSGGARHVAAIGSGCTLDIGTHKRRTVQFTGDILASTATTGIRINDMVVAYAVAITSYVSNGGILSIGSTSGGSDGNNQNKCIFTTITAAAGSPTLAAVLSGSPNLVQAVTPSFGFVMKVVVFRITGGTVTAYVNNVASGSSSYYNGSNDDAFAGYGLGGRYIYGSWSAGSRQLMYLGEMICLKASTAPASVASILSRYLIDKWRPS